MTVLFALKRLFALSVSPATNQTECKTSGDENGVKTEVDIEGVEVTRCPSGNKELWANGVSSSPTND